MWRMVALAGLSLGVACGVDPVYESAKRKIALVREDRAQPGSRVWLSLAELNAFGKNAALEAVPHGLRNPRLELGNGAAAGSALIDFLKVRQIKGPAPNPLVAWFLSGERPVRAEARIESGRGRATVHLQKVTVSWMTAQGAVLDFLIENFLLPFYPEAKIGTPFELKHNVERFEISPAGVNVVIAPKR
jgi:hypothetical protein